MTVLSPDEAEDFRNFLDEITEDEELISIKFTTVVDKMANPDYRKDAGQNKDKVYPQFNNFKCRIYHLLSSKLNRIFRSGFAGTISDLGKIDETIWILEYTNDKYELLASSGAATNTLPSATELEDNAATFIIDGVRLGAKVKNLTDDSEAIVTKVENTKLTFASLDGGTNNTFENTDEYEVYNKNYLVEDDQAFIPQTNSWGTVLNTIPDSEGLQIASFVKDV